MEVHTGSLRSSLLARTYSLAAESVEAVRPEQRFRSRRDHAGDEQSDRVVGGAQAWRALCDEECVVLELACFPGCTCRDISTLVGHTEATVKTSMRTGLTRIRAAAAPP